ncbi:hypothetical protein V6N12_050915 [Hibiscus sabdariffa]|uniref:Carbohydrate binding module family 25 domain-containing protein n=1 Tax=Hibiscus sabdariffa TaxID=183260 RepID=A0ABR2GDS3_9ROSI
MELEKLAKYQEEKKMQEEEQRTIEVEKTTNKAGRAQAKVRFKKARNIETVDEKGPLTHANELCVHGGHNNWSDGLTIVGKLVRSEGEGGDWWYAEGTFDNLSSA